MGYVLILNNEQFDIQNKSERKNSKKDVLALKNVFYKFNCSVKIVMNPTLKDIHDNLNELLIENLKQASCLVVVLMTHGLENDHAYAKDKIYNIGDEILKSKSFQDFKDLPKILIIQACKNEDKDFKASCEHTKPKVYNTFRYNSCFEGGKSLRADGGTLFIQTLYNNLNNYGLDEDIESIAKRVNREFENEYKDYKQNPTILKYNGGFDKFCFGNNVKKTFCLKENVSKSFVVG
ncbi:caspase-8-like [Episyrphus balteatus]|uniref:caspase-8-like n=1 Tax=Episyrphus balteatus TaxID=286459 RepID=UPI002484DA93|nr:caspase-8-like [Episyrphus balteatus]